MDNEKLNGTELTEEKINEASGGKSKMHYCELQDDDNIKVCPIKPRYFFCYLCIKNPDLQ
ncbi:MAG: hypothetical protein KBT27_13045 [Prevotellaceae bacterium]|nr:hypothetical protein [Candidatus Faecinaster equi]